MWHAFQGPGNDWPLALCDIRTVGPTDGVAADIVYSNRFTENTRLFYSPQHRWFYFRDLGLGEILLFRQADTGMDGEPLKGYEGAPGEYIYGAMDFEH
jgi:ribosomal protein S18 acetylase RimI-like enzyme